MLKKLINKNKFYNPIQMSHLNVISLTVFNEAALHPMSEQTKWVLLSLKINLLQSDKKKFEDVRLLICISRGEKKVR